MKMVAENPDKGDEGRAFVRCQELHERYKVDTEFSNSVITRDKTLIFEYDSESKHWSSK